MSSQKNPPIVAPYYAAAAAWLLYALLFPLYRPLHFIGAAASAGTVFLIAFFLCRRGRKASVTQHKTASAETHRKAKEEAAETTGDPALDQMIREGALAISEMKRLDINIEDEKISADIVHLQQTAEKIFNYVKSHPKKLPDIRKFMNYYLPTTLKILNSYDRMSAVGISGDNINATLDQIQNLMGTIVAAFDKQLDALFGEEAMDISTDITVLEAMMAQEGLTGQKMKADEKSEDDTIRLSL